MTKRIHRHPAILIEGQKPKRVRRTKEQMRLARAQEHFAALWAELLPLAEKRLAEATPAQKRRASRIVNRWS